MRVHIRSNGREITGLKLFGMSPNEQEGTQAMLSIETEGSVVSKSNGGLLSSLLNTVNGATTSSVVNVKERLGDY